MLFEFFLIEGSKSKKNSYQKMRTDIGYNNNNNELKAIFNP